jgi:hypothetical protein
LRTGRREDGNETTFTDCCSSARLRSDFGSDQIDASDTAFGGKRGRMEMQQVGDDSDDLRAQPRYPV